MNGANVRQWSDDDKAKLEKLLRQGLTATQIAPQFGVSRNAVLGAKMRHLPHLMAVATVGRPRGAPRGDKQVLGQVPALAGVSLAGDGRKVLAATGQQIEAVKAHLASGRLSQVEIAAAVGLTSNQVKKLSVDFGGSARSAAEQRKAVDKRLQVALQKRRAIAAGDLAPPVYGYKADSFKPGYFGQEARVLSVADLKPGQCKFPIDLDGGGTGFCGAAQEKDGVYCSHHASRCYNADSSRMTRRLRGEFEVAS